MQNYVLLSGAAGGIGKATALALAAQQWTVFAGVMNSAEADELHRSGEPRIVPVLLDVTCTDSIAAAMVTVERAMGAGGTLSALINNAGVNYNAPVHVLDVGEIRQMVNVNLLGPILLTRAALPLLKPSQGRVVFVGSATGLMASPAVSVYAATKSGLEGLGDALRVELGVAGLRVSLVVPGVVRTPMTSGAPGVLDRMLGRMNAVDLGRYEKLMRKIVAMSAADKAGVTPETVAGAITHALTAPRPKSRYRVGIDCQAVAVLRHLPDSVRDFIQRKTFGI